MCDKVSNYRKCQNSSNISSLSIDDSSNRSQNESNKVLFVDLESLRTHLTIDFDKECNELIKRTSEAISDASTDSMNTTSNQVCDDSTSSYNGSIVASPATDVESPSTNLSENLIVVNKEGTQNATVIETGKSSSYVTADKNDLIVNPYYEDFKSGVNAQKTSTPLVQRPVVNEREYNRLLEYLQILQILTAHTDSKLPLPLSIEIPSTVLYANRIKPVSQEFIDCISGLLDVRPSQRYGGFLAYQSSDTTSSSSTSIPYSQSSNNNFKRLARHSLFEKNGLSIDTIQSLQSMPKQLRFKAGNTFLLDATIDVEQRLAAIQDVTVPFVMPLPTSITQAPAPTFPFDGSIHV